MIPNSPTFFHIKPYHIKKLYARLRRWRYNVALAAADVANTADAQILLIMIYWRNKGVIELTRRCYRNLTTEEKFTIMEMYKAGYSIYAIAKKLDRPSSTIYYYLKRIGIK